MRKRRIFAAATVLALIGIVALCLATARERPKLAIGVVEYRKMLRGALSVRLGVTNVGPSTIEFNPGYNVLLRIQSEEGWKTESLPNSPMLMAPVMLEPGEDRVVMAALPRQALYWQIRYVVRTPSGQSRVARKLSKLSPKWRQRLHPALWKLLSNQGPAATEIWSPVFDAKSFREAHPGELMEVEIPWETALPNGQR